MVRVVKHSASSPAKVTTKSGDSVFICRCGLTTNEDGTCSGKHAHTIGEEESKLYSYNDEFERHECDGCKNCG
jgi:CDGSH-type Zn-finger protein